MTETFSDLMEYLAERGAPYDIPADDLLAAIPESAREPKLAFEFMQLKDISHIEPLSKGGATAGDNWVLEDSSVNRARGAETMTQTEQNTAELDGIRDAQSLRQDLMVDRTIASATGALTAGVAVATVGLPVAAVVAGAVALGRWLDSDLKRQEEHRQKTGLTLDQEKLGYFIEDGVVKRPVRPNPRIRHRPYWGPEGLEYTTTRVNDDGTTETVTYSRE